MTDKPLRPATLAAQGLGWTDARPARWCCRSSRRRPIFATPTTSTAAAATTRAPTIRPTTSPRRCWPRSKAARRRCFPSGMAAATAVFRACRPAPMWSRRKVMYWACAAGSRASPRRALEVDFVDMAALDAMRDAVRPGRTKLVWVETPANPLWTITDIAGAAEIAHRRARCSRSTAPSATPVLTRPLEFGADIVMHSATKYLNGHSDVVAGALDHARDDEFWQRLVAGAHSGGAHPRQLRGVAVAARHAHAVSCGSSAPANRRSASPRRFARPSRIAEVLYPGLPDHPGHAVAARQMTGGFGGMLSIRVKAARRGHRRRRRGRHLEARDIARRRRKPDRAPRLDRGPGQPRAARPVAPLGRHRGSADDLIADLDQALTG